MRQSKGMAEPPEGVLAGENVPVESEPDNYTEAEIEEIEGSLKARGEPFISMSDSELRERAIEFHQKFMEDG